MEKDLRLIVAAEFFRTFCLLYSVGTFVMYALYPMLFSDGHITLGIISLGLWIFNLVRAFKKKAIIDSGAYSVVTEQITNKYVDNSGDSSTEHITLRSQSGDREQTVSRAVYLSCSIGDTVISVFMPGAKSPIHMYRSY